MAILNKFRRKHGKGKKAGSEGRASVSGYASGEEETEELTPLDIIKQDTDIFSDEEAQVFTLPAPSMEISDYTAYMFIPSEDIKNQSVRPIQ